ncbi:hypothetical protein EG68_00514 [Paragonimus skrjabini miyazakii]|uniref:Uncharacterized protein n=1 Tax=Paragonimus skrjabini miyazakii TaxID=59628 RepID=A0A8S9Z3X9_9TREM|nr:hypothetical protein EG68_00514 [Paragonimus skrjabini miyazakii]
MLQRKVYGVCQVLRAENNNWLIGPLLSSREAHTVIIQLIFTMRSCREHPDPDVLLHCQEHLELHVFQSDGQVSEENLMEPDGLSSFRLVANLTLKEMTWSNSYNVTAVSPGSNTAAASSNAFDSQTNPGTELAEERVARYTNRMLSAGSHLALAIRDRGSCSTLRRIRLTYLACPRIQTHFIQFPRTVTLDSGHPTVVQAQCIPGSAMKTSGMELPKLVCLPDGRWYHSSTMTNYSVVPSHVSHENGIFLNVSKCLCMPGFGFAVDAVSRELMCKECTNNEYKVNWGPVPCRACPKNSHKEIKDQKSSSLLSNFPVVTMTSPSMPGVKETVTGCQCLTGYFRHPELDTEDTPCTTLPSKPRTLNVNITDPARIELWWLVPIETGGRADLWYVVQCLENSNVSCASQATFVPPAPTRMTSTVLIGLTLGKTYLISVIASNELTELFTEETWSNSTSSTLVSLPEAVNITVHNLSLESVDADQVNSSVSSVGVGESQTDPNEAIKKSTYVRLKWGAPKVSSQWDRQLQANRLQHRTGRFPSVVEYQVYVWMNPVSGTHRHPDSNQRPILIHFLSDNLIFLTDLPRRAVFTVWVRPRMTFGWGRFAKSTFDYPGTVALHRATSSKLMSDADGTHIASDTVLENSGTDEGSVQNKTKFIWLAIFFAVAGCLLFCLLILVKSRRILHGIHFLGRNTSEQVEDSASLKGKHEVQLPEPVDQEKLIAELQQQEEEQLSSPSSSAENVEEGTQGNRELQAVKEATARESSQNDSQPLNLVKLTSDKTSKELEPSRIKIKSTIGEG